MRKQKTTIPRPYSTSTEDFRIERDSLGEVRVPKKALWGAQTQRALENFPISGESAAPALIRAYLRLKQAAAYANARSGALQPNVAQRIQRAAQKFLKMPAEHWKNYFPVDIYQAGAGTSQNMNLNEVLGRVAKAHPNDEVNRSQSTNDTFPTAMRLAILEASAPLVAELGLLSESFGRHAREWHSIPKSARTHLQDAVPMRLGAEWGAYARAVLRCAEAVREAREELRILGIGGSAAGTALNVPRRYPAEVVRELSRLTGEPLKLAPDFYYSMQSMAPFVRYSSALRLMAIELTRICNDLRLLASGPMTGLAELLLPEVQPGSSIMPGKVNPSILEMANQVFFSVQGYDHSVALAAQAGQLELNVMMPLIVHALLKATLISENTCRVLRLKCVDGIQPNRDRLLRYFESTPQVATALSPRLGYAETAKLVKEAIKKGVSVIDLVRERDLIPPKELARLLDARLLTGR